MRLGSCIAFVLLVSTLPAASADAPLLGKFAFSSAANPDKIHCAKIDEKLAAQLKAPKYICTSTPLSSGKSALSCAISDDKPGYMVFETMKACESERKDEAAAE